MSDIGNLPPDLALAHEPDRVKAVIGLVYENRHYSHKCFCDQCCEVREHLSPEDRSLVDHISRVVRTSSPEPV